MIGDIVVPRLKLQIDSLFEPGEAELTRDAIKRFAKVAVKIGAFVQNFSPSKLLVEGHTDADGDPESNRELSKRRAETIRSYLIDAYDYIGADMIEARGYGEQRPIAPNDTPENKARNRRIEIIAWGF